MENAFFGLAQLRQGGLTGLPLAPKRRLMQVAVSDIARRRGRGAGEPRAYAGKRFDLGRRRTQRRRAVAILSKVTGRPLSYFQGAEAMIAGRWARRFKMYEWFETTGYLRRIARRCAATSPRCRGSRSSLGARRRDWKEAAQADRALAATR